MTAATKYLTPRERELLDLAAARDLRWYEGRLWERVGPAGLLPFAPGDSWTVRSLAERGLLRIEYGTVTLAPADHGESSEPPGHPDQTRHAAARGLAWALALMALAALIGLVVFALGWGLITGGWL